MTKEASLAKTKSLFDKLTTEDALENYNLLGEHLHERIENEQRVLSEKNESLNKAKAKIKNGN